MKVVKLDLSMTKSYHNDVQRYLDEFATPTFRQIVKYELPLDFILDTPAR